MQTPQLSRIKIQDTPIRSIYLEWWEGDTFFVADVPVAWALRVLGVQTVTSRMVDNPDYHEGLMESMGLGFPRYCAAIHADFPERISSLTCAADAPIPSIFQSAA